MADCFCDYTTKVRRSNQLSDFLYLEDKVLFPTLAPENYMQAAQEHMYSCLPLVWGLRAWGWITVPS